MALSARKKWLITLTLVVVLFSTITSAVSADVGLWASPPVPTWITATEGTWENRVYIEWAASAGATKYKLFRAPQGFTTWTELVPYELAHYYDYSALPATVYDYRVRACNASDQCSNMSSIAIGYRRLAAPDDVAATDGSYLDKVRVTWSASDPQTWYYRVYRSTWAGGYKTDLGYSYSTTFDDTTAIPGTDYYYYVKAIIDDPVYDTDSDYSDYDMGYRLIGLPYAIWASDGTFTDKVVVSWPAVIGATSYNVYRGPWVEVDPTWNTSWEGITTPYYWDTSAIPGWFYYYWVVPCDSHGCRNAGTGPDDGWLVAPSPTPTNTEIPPAPTATASNTPSPTLEHTPTNTPGTAPTITSTNTPGTGPTGTPTRTRRPSITPTSTRRAWTVTPWTPSNWLYLPLVWRGR